MVAAQDGAFEGGQHPLGDPHGGPVVLEVLAQHDELVTAEAGHRVVRPQDLP